MNPSERLRVAIESGDVISARSVLSKHADTANTPISWYLNQTNVSDPLHYICDCIYHGQLVNGSEVELATLLLQNGARVNGTAGRESPLIGATSLGVESVAAVLIGAGANLQLTSVFGANALHWAAYVGIPATVELLIENGAELETRCSEFGATPLFWAVQGYSRHGPKRKRDQLGAAKVLIEAGANLRTGNAEGTSLRQRAGDSDSAAMLKLIKTRLIGR